MTYRPPIQDGAEQLSVHILSKYLTCIKIPVAPTDAIICLTAPAM